MSDPNQAMVLLGLTVDLQALMASGCGMVSASYPDRQRAFELLREVQAGLRKMAGAECRGEIAEQIIAGTGEQVVELLRGVAASIEGCSDAALAEPELLRQILVQTDMVGATLRNYLHIRSVVA